MDKGIEFRSLAELRTNELTSTSRRLLAALNGLADVKRNLIGTRTAAGRERAKARSVKLGHRAKLTPHERCDAIRRDIGQETFTDLAHTNNLRHS